MFATICSIILGQYSYVLYSPYLSIVWKDMGKPTYRESKYIEKIQNRLQRQRISTLRLAQL